MALEVVIEYEKLPEPINLKLTVEIDIMKFTPKNMLSGEYKFTAPDCFEEVYKTYDYKEVLKLDAYKKLYLRVDAKKGMLVSNERGIKLELYDENYNLITESLGNIDKSSYINSLLPIEEDGTYYVIATNRNHDTTKFTLSNHEYNTTTTTEGIDISNPIDLEGTIEGKYDVEKLVYTNNDSADKSVRIENLGKQDLLICKISSSSFQISFAYGRSWLCGRCKTCISLCSANNSYIFFLPSQVVSPTIRSAKYVYGHFWLFAKPYVLLISGHKFLGRSTSASGTVSLLVPQRPTHATPAAFYAHQINRSMYQEIATEMLTSGVDFFVGGGRNDFELRIDSLNYSDSLRNINYNIVYSLDSVEAPVLLPFGALCADYDMPQARERGNFLPDAVDLAIKSLDARGDGFFLMVEGSQIDYQGHGNSTEGVVDEMLDFDRAIQVALDFAERDGETLVVITADHETGGMTIMNGSYDDRTIEAQFNTGGHTGTMVPIYSFGPCADKFTGIMENTEIPLRIKSALGL